MTTKLGKKLAALKLSCIENPALKMLVGEMHGRVVCGSRGFNDKGIAHYSDYIDNRSGRHTDLTKYTMPHRYDDSNYTDISHRDGTRESHGDEYSPCDDHSDTGWWSDYSDMCR